MQVPVARMILKETMCKKTVIMTAVNDHHVLQSSSLFTINYFHGLDFWNLFEFALTVLGIDVSAADSRGSFPP